MDKSSETVATYTLPQNPVTVWRFREAPEYFRSLSHHGGDEDWVILGRRDLVEAIADRLEVCDTQYEQLTADVIVGITSHA